MEQTPNPSADCLGGLWDVNMCLSHLMVLLGHVELASGTQMFIFMSEDEDVFLL